MYYFVSEDTQISGKWIQLISRSVDIKDQSVSPSVHDRLTSASQSLCLSRTDRVTYIKIIYKYIYIYIYIYIYKCYICRYISFLK